MKYTKSIIFFFVTIICFFNLSICVSPKLFTSFNFYKIHDDFIYRLSDSNISILHMNNSENIELINQIKEEENVYNSELFIHNNKLLIVSLKYLNEKSFVNICVYDVYDKKNLFKIKELEVDGSNYIFKERDGIIYLVAQNFIEDDLSNKDMVINTNNKISIVSMNLNNDIITTNVLDFGICKVKFMHLGSNSLYLIDNDYIVDKAFTSIYKFDLNKDSIQYVDKISFDGDIFDEKFVDEYDGNLRIISSSEDSSKINNIYIFDENLKMINYINIMIGEESITDVLFDKERCYIASFLEKGNFIVCDLNIDTPREISRIKISSLINHMYLLKKGSIVCIGNDSRMDKYQNLQSGQIYEILKNTGIKLMVLDLNDELNIRLSSEYLVKGKQTSIPFINKNILNNFKQDNYLIVPLSIIETGPDIDINSAMEVSSRNIFSKNIFDSMYKIAYVFSFDDNGEISLKFTIDLKEENNSKVVDIDEIKIVNDKIFVFTSLGIRVLDFLSNQSVNYIF